MSFIVFFFQAEDGIRDYDVTGVQTCALPIFRVRNAAMGIDGEDHDHGCLITRVPDGMPAKQAGLKKGDIITKLNGKRVTGIIDLAQRIGARKPGDTIKLEILRGDKTLEKDVTLVKPSD